MKRFAASLMAVGLVLFAAPSGASAQEGGYNDAGATVTVSTPSPAASASFTVNVNNCKRASVTFTFQGTSKIASTNTAGTATTSFIAPAAPGTYTGTATCGTNVASFSVVVAATPTPTNPPAGLPATGSSGSGTTMMIASLLLLVGVGMFGVTQVRRRQVVA